MRIHIYYGGRGLIEDSNLYVLSRITEVLEELRVEVKRYNLYECKNEILTTRLFISKEEVGQMNNHIGWFEENYGADATVKYVHVHPTNIISSKANYNKEIFVLTPKVLEVLKEHGVI